MSKALSEMTLEELWQRFPISLVEPHEKWARYYSEMESFLKSILADYAITRISHVGSTAINGIWAKNIVDILLEIECDENREKVAETIENQGFLRMSTSPRRISFNHGYTRNGFAERVYHLHVRYAGDNRELYFRDYLNEHPAVAKEYEQLKLELWKKYEYHRDAYTNAKTAFIEKWTTEAKRIYKNRYGSLSVYRTD
ncbi:MAG: GrpB family protein [Planctomycetia bacterium]|nr:GrpB family protein [Planctomycetia bacterium]